MERSKQPILFIEIVGIVALLILGYLFFSTGKSNSLKKTEKALDAQQLFEMKAKCAIYKDEIEKRLQETFWTSYIVEEIFYSPVENSCLYAVFAYQELGSYSAYMIWDYFTDSLVFYRDTTLTKGQDLDVIYKNATKYLMGEQELKYSKEDWNLSD